jgi:hypothetical protein
LAQTSNDHRIALCESFASGGIPGGAAGLAMEQWPNLLLARKRLPAAPVNVSWLR